MSSDNIALEAAKSAAESAGKESVSKIADVIGAIFPFFGTTHEAVKIYIEEIKNSNMSPEAKLITIANTKKTYRELINQSKIMKIAEESAKEGTDFSKSSTVDNDWLARFMDSAKFVSNDMMQLVWGRILAGEFELPGSTPPQIIRVLSEITLNYAQIFNSLCNFISTMKYQIKNNFEEEKVIIIDIEDKYFNSLSINFKTLCELQNYGLIEFDNPVGFVKIIPKEELPKFDLIYGDKIITVVDFPEKAFPIGHVLLTDAGQCIAKIIEKDVIEGYFDTLVNYLEKKGVVISP